MTIPDTMVPTKPDDKIIISTRAKDVIFENVLENASPGPVKYSPRLLSPTIKEITNGYRMAINHVLLNSIFKINAIPKKITKYNTTDTIN